MKRFTKICLWIAGILLVFGILLTAVSWALGFRGWHPLQRGKLQLEEVYQPVTGEIRRLEVDVEAGSLFVEAGEEFAVTAVTTGRKIKSTVKNGTWCLEADRDGVSDGESVYGGVYVDNEGIYFGSGIGEVHITVPRGVCLESVEIEVDGGAVEIEHITCRRMEIDVSAGSAEFSADVKEGLYVDCSAGGVTGILDGKEQDFRVEADCSAGGVTVGSREVGGLVSHNLSGEQSGTKNMQLTCSAGGIDITFTEE